MNRILVHRWFKIPPIYTPGWRKALWGFKYLAKVPWPGLHAEESVLNMRPPRLHLPENQTLCSRICYLYLCQAMTVTQWSLTSFAVSSITPGDRGGVPSRIKDISLEQFALLPSALVLSVSRKENIFSRPQTSDCSLTFRNVGVSFSPHLCWTMEIL